VLWEVVWKVNKKWMFIQCSSSFPEGFLRMLWSIVEADACLHTWKHSLKMPETAVNVMYWHEYDGLPWLKCSTSPLASSWDCHETDVICRLFFHYHPGCVELKSVAFHKLSRNFSVTKKERSMTLGAQCRIAKKFVPPKTKSWISISKYLNSLGMGQNEVPSRRRIFRILKPCCIPPFSIRCVPLDCHTSARSFLWRLFLLAAVPALAEDFSQPPVVFVSTKDGLAQELGDAGMPQSWPFEYIPVRKITYKLWDVGVLVAVTMISDKLQWEFHRHQLDCWGKKPVGPWGLKSHDSRWLNM